MIAKQIALHNFRSAADETVSFSDGVNLLYGKNAQGKTNVLEAVYFFARGKSFRGAKDADLLRFGSDGFSVELLFAKNGEEKLLSYRYFDGERQRLCNGVKISAREQIGKFNAVFFCPDHLQILKSAPENRREFLNIALSQVSSVYLSALSAHKKLTDQKNALLKSENGFDPSLMAAYHEKLAEVSAGISAARQEYVQKLQLSVQRTLCEISGGKEDIRIFYKRDIPAELSRLSDVTMAYRELFDRMLRKEAAAGMCLCGIRRDDLVFTVNGMDARQFCSQGQQRSVALALKIAEGEILAEETGEMPVYLFDDVLGELDSDRKAYMLQKIKGRQMIVTDCDASLYENVPGIHKIFVENGTYREE